MGERGGSGSAIRGVHRVDQLISKSVRLKRRRRSNNKKYKKNTQQTKTVQKPQRQRNGRSRQTEGSVANLNSGKGTPASSIT